MTIHCPPSPESLVKTVYYNLYFKVCLNLRLNRTFFVEAWEKTKPCRRAAGQQPVGGGGKAHDDHPDRKNARRKAGERIGHHFLRRGLRRKVGIFRSSSSV